jgi:hypothetical protein
MDLRSHATFYRTALLLGLVPGEAVIRWASDVIAHEPAPPTELFDVVLARAGDLTALRLALQPLADAEESPGVVAAMLDLAGRDLARGVRTVGDTVTVLAQVRRFLPPTAAHAERLDAFEDDHMLAVAGVAGDAEGVGAALAEWLRGFAGAASRWLHPAAYHVLLFASAGEAAAFTAALSRVVASPRGAGASTPLDPVELWGCTRQMDGDIPLFLSEAALRVAAGAFAPLPATTRCGRDDLPSGVAQVIDGEAPRPLGVEEAAFSLAAVCS